MSWKPDTNKARNAWKSLVGCGAIFLFSALAISWKSAIVCVLLSAASFAITQQLLKRVQLRRMSISLFTLAAFGTLIAAFLLKHFVGEWTAIVWWSLSCSSLFCAMLRQILLERQRFDNPATDVNKLA